MRRTPHPAHPLISTKFKGVWKTVKQTQPSYHFRNYFYVWLKWKVCEFLGIFWQFFGYAFLRPLGDTPIFCQMKGLMKIRKYGKFHQYSICGCQVMNVQMFSEQQKMPFLGAFGWFFGHNSPQCSQILFKFGTVIQTNILHHIYYDFWDSAENLKKLPQKPHFVVGFQRFLDHALFRRVGDAPIFGQMKGLMEIHNSGKFHWYSICGCQVIYFQSLSYQQKVGFLAAFWVGFGRLQAQIKSSLYKTFTSDEVQGKVSHVLWALIYYWKFQEMDPKNPIFWAFFRDFLTTPSHSLWVTPKSFIK